MSNEPVLNSQPSPPPDTTTLVQNASLAVEARIERIIGGGNFGFWTAFIAICLSAVGLLVIALFKGLAG